MGHRSLRLLIEHTAKKLGDDIQFTYARTSDFNILRGKRYPFITSDLLVSTPVFSVDNVYNYQKAWLANMAFYQLDTAASTQEEYALILDEMDTYVDNFINQINFFMLNGDINSDDIIITFGQQQPFIKATADILTGWTIPITFQVTNQFNYCEIGC